MKRTELSAYLREEVISILAEADAEDITAQQDLNKELETTKSHKDELGDALSENINPEVTRLVNAFTHKMADRYGIPLQHVVNNIMTVLRSQNYDGLNEAKETWVVYDIKTKKRLPNAGKTWSTMKAAKAFAGKQKNADVASDTWYFDKIQKSTVNEAEDMSDEEMDKKASKAAKKGGSVSTISNKLQQTTKEMKQVVKKWKDSEGAEKAKLTDRLKELTKIKKEIESLL